jgi:hypothetical protein
VAYLSAVEFNGIPVDDVGLINLAGLTRLKRLELSSIKMTDLAFVQTLTGLEELILKDTPVSDAGLDYLQGLDHLRSLILVDTNGTDVRLTRPKSLPSVQQLYIAGPSVTDAGVEDLRRTLPTVKIAR